MCARTGDMPVALMFDGPSLGGFVCPATITSTELWKMGQVSAKDTVLFKPVTLGLQHLLLDMSISQQALVALALLQTTQRADNSIGSCNPLGALLGIVALISLSCKHTDQDESYLQKFSGCMQMPCTFLPSSYHLLQRRRTTSDC